MLFKVIQMIYLPLRCYFFLAKAQSQISVKIKMKLSLNSATLFKILSSF